MDHILYWNEVALEANRTDFTAIPEGEKRPRPEQGGPTLSSRALAIVHLAMYDAHAGAVAPSPALPRYLAAPASPPNASPSAAVAAAAHTVLCTLYPRQRASFEARLQSAPIHGPFITEGHDFGLGVARAHLADRKGDPDASDSQYSASMAKGHHRVDPGSPGQGFHAPRYGAESRAYAVKDPHELPPPPGLGSARYLAALRQVRGKGIAPELLGTLPAGTAARSADETVAGIFWGYDGARELGTPPRLYNQIVRKVARAKGNDVHANARLFAFVNAAMADAGVFAWRQKYKSDLWRPVVGIREHGDSMGPIISAAAKPIDADCDAQWLPLGAPASNSSDGNGTPPFPAYPSGHATFGAAALHVTRLFYGTPVGNRGADTHFTAEFVSDEMNGITKDNKGVVRPRHARKFDGLWEMILENGFGRVFLGVHWSFDAFDLGADGKPVFGAGHDIGGVPLGLAIAEDIWQFGAGVAPKKSPV